MFKLFVPALVAGFLWATPAFADVTCVQQGLTDLGFDPGPVDGALGKKSIAAAALFAANAGITLEPLSKDNSDVWCSAITEFARSPDARTISHLDLVSEPDGILSAKTQQKLWGAYKSAKECFEFPDYDPGYGYKLPVIGPEQFTDRPWSSPLTQVAGAPECAIEPGLLRAPKPISKVVLDEAYGERQESVDEAAVWFRRITTYLRLTADPIASEVLRQALIDWAKADGLGSGIRVSWDHKPVDYQMMATILSISTAAAQLAPDLTAEERGIIGPWLNKRLAEMSDSRWKDRQDNKQYMRAYAAMLWGLMVGDDRPVQEAIFEYKLAIHDMRPDGSWPVDSQRGAMGLHYNSASASQPVMIAIALKAARNIDLFDYQVDGRSVHDAIDWVVHSIKDPKAANEQYAISCPDGGDRFGSIDKPNETHLEEAGYLLAYAAQFPERESSKFIIEYFAGKPAPENERNGGRPQCLFALQGGTVDLPPLVMPEPLPEMPEPKVVVHTHEEAAMGDPSTGKVNSLFAAEIEKGDPVFFKMEGTYAAAVKNFLKLDLVIHKDLGDVSDAIKACGTKIETYDDGANNAVLEFTKDGEGLKAKNADCIVAALPKEQAYMANFLLQSFQDIAIGMLIDGTVNDVASEGLREFFGRVSMGEITLAK